jgi:hypothetical protein
MRRLLVRLMPVALLGSCGGINADPLQLLRDAASAMLAVHSFAVDLKLGPGATFSGATLTSATGRVKQNGDSETQAIVRQADFVVQAELISAGGRTYFRATSFLPFTQLSAAEAEQYPSTGRLLDPAHGLFALLHKGRGPHLDGSEDVDGHACDRVVAIYPSDQLSAVLTPIKSTGDLELRLWIGRNDHLVRRGRLSGHLFDPAKTSFLEVHLRDFNTPIEISPPA